MKRSPPCRSLRLLLIENDPHDALLVHAALSATRDESSSSFELIHVIHANRLSAALRRLEKGGIDVVLMGLSWPDPDSQRTPPCNILQAEAPGVPLVVLTRHEHENIEREAKGKGAEEYLGKDRLDGSTLSRALHRAIEHQQVRLALERLERDTRTRDARAVTSASR